MSFGPQTHLEDPVTSIRRAIGHAAAQLGAGDHWLPRLDRPPKAQFGDFSTNAAMVLSSPSKGAPRELAAQLAQRLADQLADDCERVEVAGPGFVNLFMTERWWREALVRALELGWRFGSQTAPETERILVEFVSANPTGPLTVASGRHAAYGDSLSRILGFAGHAVEREYYTNDFGSQVQRFGESIGARARGAEPPDDGYRGAYVAELAAQIPDSAQLSDAELARRGVASITTEVQRTLARFRVSFDRFFSERSLHEGSVIDQLIAQLDQRGELYRADGALWLATTRFGDDKDRVLQRSSGEFTYFAADIAYHADKRERGFDRLLDIWGADHHGYVGRMRAAWQALGGDPEAFEPVIMQLVNLLEHGQRVQMSKREGEFVTLADLLDDIGTDAARFFLLQRSHDTTLDLDLALARQQTQDNPVYYVQYAHARLAGILEKATPQRVAQALAQPLAGQPGQLHPSERALVGRLLEFPGEAAAAAERRAPHRIAAYVHDLAQDFSAFYRDCRVVGAAEEGADESFRIALCVQTQRVIAVALDLLGVSAPERM